MKRGKLSKIIVSVVLSLMLVFSFVACGDKNGDSEVDSIDIQSTLALNVGEETKLQVALEPFGVNATVTWKSSDTSVATVSKDGVVKGEAQGVAIVRATAGGKSANCTVRVTDPSLATANVTKVAFNTGVLKLEVGQTGTLTATVSPENAADKTLTWKSSKPAVATVDGNGVVTAVSAGNANITATSNSNNKIKATCRVTVGGGAEDQTPLHVAKVNSLADRDDFIMGMDASAVPSLEAAGVTYKNFDGATEDVYKILKDNGITDIRIRVWNYPYQQDHYGEAQYGYGGGNCDIENAVAISERCEAVGLGVIIDFHYSDFWADPSKQKAPKAWKDYTTAQRKTAIYDFTKDSLEKIAETGVKITMVQIGNETTRYICEADYDSNRELYCAYLNAGSRAVREVTGAVAQGGAKVAIHLTNPESRDYVGYANTFKENEVDYDVFGSSYYPYWHGTLANLATKLKNVHNVSGKDVMVLETSYAFTNEDFDGCGNTRLDNQTEPYTVQGQSNSILNVIKTIADLGDYGLGVCYWEGTWIPATTSNNLKTNLEKCSQYGCGWASAKAGIEEIGGDNYQVYYKDGKVDAGKSVTAAGGVVIDNQAFFMADGTVLESLKVFKLAKEGQEVEYAADYLYDEEIYYTVDEGTIELPQKVTIVLNDGSVMSVDALWDAENSEVAEYIHKVGDYVINGTTPYGGSVKCTVYVQNKNLLHDGGFEDTNGYGSVDFKIDIPKYWQAEQITHGDQLQLYVSNKSDDAEMGSNSFHFWDIPEIEFKLFQEVDLANARSIYGNGKYGFSIDFAGGAFGEDQKIYSYAIITYNDGTEALTVAGNEIKATGWKQWSRTALEVDITANVASVKVGISVKGESETGPWGNIDNAQFFFKG